MDPASEFKPPQNEEEFEKRAKDVTSVGARAVLRSLRARKAAMVKSVDEEIAFYEKVLTSRGEEV